ncbi:MAG: cytochrome c [Bacteroidota bacterium]|nr:cytochrome c [Bacteroidota bacterium]
MKNLVLTTAVFAAICFVIACGGSDTSSKSPVTDSPAGISEYDADPVSSDPKGSGKFTNVELTHPLDQKMVADGQKVFDVKCSSCHKLTDERVVGPGWKGVTSRRTPEWFMNFITNTDEMLNKDAEALSMLEICLVRMPNQNLSDDEARAVLEFARNNDGDK